MHWTQFDRPAGRQEYRERLNVLLGRYGSGYELSDQGEILQIGPRGMNSLHSASLPEAPSNVANKVQAAVNRFRRYGSSIADRHSAVRDLADVLEYIRKQVKVVLLKKDESELFDLANNFGIRHFNETQKLEYDRAVWLSWMFYHYPATIHAFFI